MRYSLFLSFLLLIPFTVQAQTQEPSPNADHAQKIVQMLIDGDFTGAYDQFDTTMQGAVSSDQLAQAWQQIINQAGAFEAITHVRDDAASNRVIVTMQFDKIVLDASVVFDADDKVAGLRFAAATSDQPTATPVFATPTYVLADSFTETPVTVGDLRELRPAHHAKLR